MGSRPLLGSVALHALVGQRVAVHDDAVAVKITKLIGGRVSLQYKEKVGLPTTHVGETRQFVTGVMPSAEFPPGSGELVRTMPEPPHATANAASR